MFEVERVLAMSLFLPIAPSSVLLAKASEDTFSTLAGEKGWLPLNVRHAGVS